MEGSVAASSSERLRHAVQRYRAVGAAQSDERLQGLFEQLLNVPTAFTQVEAKPAAADQDKPAEPTEDAPAATSKSKSSSESGKADDKPDDSDQDDAQGVSAEAAGAAASAAAQAAVAPVQVTATQAKVEDKSAKSDTSEAPVTVTAQVSTVVAKEASTTGDAVTTAADTTTVAKSAEPESVVCPAEQVQAVSKDTQIVNAKEATQVSAPEAVKQTQNAVHVEGKTKGEPRSKETAEVKPEGSESIAANGKTDKPEVKEGHHEAAHQRHEQNDEQNISKPNDSTVATQGAAPKSKGDGDRPERREKWFERDADANGPKGIDASQASGSTNDIPQPQPSTAWSGTTNDPSLTAAAGANVPSDASLAANANVNAGADLAASIASASGAVSSTASVSTDGSAGQENGRAHLGHSSTGQVGSASNGGSSSSAVNVAGRPSTVTGGSGSAAAAGKADPTDKSQDVPGLSQMERVRLVQRVARSFNRLGADGGQVTLKLHPPELGVLNMTVKIEGNTLSAKLQTESTAAQQALLENLPQLKDKLAEQGVEVTRFQVEVSPQQDWSAGANSSNTGNQNSSSSGDEARSREIDYRRLNRSAYDTSAVSGAVRSTRAGWDSPSSWSAANRSLDVEV